ncbi:trigger factor [Candidatus Latescibacterota bacterium]
MPKVEIKETVGCTKKLRVEIEPERLEEEIKSTVRKVKQNTQIPGFRKGKAPESMLLKRFGPTIRQEAVGDMIPKVLQEVFKDEGIKPVNDPNITDLKFDETGPITFTVAVEELPEIDVSSFEGLKVTKEIREVTDEDVDNEIERIRQYQATEEEVDRGAQKDDILIANLQKLDTSGVPIIGEKMENHVIYLNGTTTPSPEFDEQIIGMEKGNKKIIRFTYDESIDNPQLVGTSDAYEVEIVQVLERNVPELTEEFITSFGDYSDIEDFRTKMRDRIERQFDSQTERKLHNDLMENFIKLLPFEVPNSMVERITESEIERIKKKNPDETFDEDAFRSSIRPDAVRSVQTYLTINTVGEKQNIEVTKEEVDERIQVLASLYDTNPREMKRSLIKDGRLDEIKNDIAQNKAFNWIVEVADVKVEKIKEQPEQSHIVKP